MPGFLWDFLSTQGFQPHGMCLLWRQDVLYAHLISDIAIAASYFSIPIAIAYFARKRRDLENIWLLYLFGAFIVACGMTHMFNVWTMWSPDYGIEAVVKIITAIASVATATLIWPMIPHLLRVPSPRALSAKNVRLTQEIHRLSRIEAELRDINVALQGGVAERTATLVREVEQRRDIEAQFRDLNDALEARVAERTATLVRANEDRSKAQAAAESASAANGEFLAMMSHEIRTPMNGVIGMLELLRGETLPPESSRLVEIAGRSADNLVGVINSILDYSRVEAGSAEVHAADFTPSTLTAQVIELLFEGAAKKGIALEADLSDDLPTLLEGDPTRIRQVLFNLIGNAIKFTDHGGVRVEVRHEMRSDGRIDLDFSVIDTGIGIAPDAASKMFQRFSRADETDRRYDGAGLGLAISRQLVTLLGGTIGFESTPGSGSRFWFRIPCRSVVAARRSSPKTENTIAMRPLSILAAEDNPTNTFVLEAYLKRQGHTVNVVKSGQEAIDQARKGGYDLVLMDLEMPGMDGLTAARMIRALDPPEGDVPIVALTAHSLDIHRIACLDAGMSDFITKPIVMSTLFDVIRAAVRQKPDVAA